MAQRNRVTWTIEPDDDVEDLMEKAIVAKVGKRNSKDPKKTRGLRTIFVNSAIRAHLSSLAGKREA